MAQRQYAQDSDILVPSPPADTISSLSVNGTVQTATTMLIATAWDNTVNCYEISQAQGIVPRAQLRHEGPVLCSDISPTDQVTTFTAGADTTVRMWNVTQPASSAQQIGKHDQPVSAVKFLPEKNCAVTGSWDKTLRMWDCRQPTPAATVGCSERVYCMDAKGSAIVTATADNKVSVFDLTAGRLVSEFASQFNFQTKSLAMFDDGKGFAMGSIEGRICVEHFDELYTKNRPPPPHGQRKPPSNNFCYKCHRWESDVYCVNALHFSHQNTYCSIGSDGVICFWDKAAKHKLATLDKFKRTCPGTDIKFSPNGQLLFYALSYDWSKGAAHNDPKLGSNILVHSVQSVEITPKAMQPKVHAGRR